MTKVTVARYQCIELDIIKLDMNESFIFNRDWRNLVHLDIKSEQSLRT